MSSPPKVDLVSILIELRRSYDFSVKTPTPVQGMLVYNTDNGKIYYGNKDGSAWVEYTSPSPSIVFSRDPELAKNRAEAERIAAEDAEVAGDIQAQTRLLFKREAARRAAGTKA
jgi:hypothetical protein